MANRKPYIVTDEMIDAYDVAWKATPAGKPGDRRRAGILAALAVMSESEGKQTVEEYAIDLVTYGAESVAEDDLNEDDKIANKDHEAAVRLALDMVDAIRANPQVLIELTATRKETHS